MNVKPSLTLPVCLFGVFVFWMTGSTGVYISHLTESCFKCLCHVSTGCALANDCQGGYCGPFNISKVYWVDAGRPVLPYDDSSRKDAWKDCVKTYACATKTIENYLSRFGKDCNGDGSTDCFDYMMVNGNGGYGCEAPLNRSENGRQWLKRYEECEF